MNIDVHTHAIPERVLALLRRDRSYGVTLDGNHWRGGNYGDFQVTAKWSDPDAKLADLAASGVDAGVISAAPKPLFYYDIDLEPAQRMCRETNLGLAEFQAVKPDRFRWMAHVPLRFPGHAVAMLHEARDAGCAGVLVGTSVGARRLDHPEYENFWSAVETLRLPVFMHPGYEHPYPDLNDYSLQPIVGMPNEMTIAIERLICAGTLERHPGVQVLCALGGGFFPYQAGRLRHCTTFRPELKGVKDPWSYVGQIKFDTNLHDVASLRFLIEVAGADNVLLGADLPFATATPMPVEMVKAAAGSEMAADRIAKRNPAAMFGF